MSKHSFKSLFEATFKVATSEEMRVERVVIPRIQRDYAQGRTVKKGKSKGLNNLGQRFIDNIFSHLNAGLPMEMDFIYGAFEKGKFIPLDGQQRLTTLYLLYWYIGNRELVNTSDLCTLLARFSYETRATARQFCKELSNELTLDFSKGTISEELKDLPWYSKIYDHDPTVIAMLNMLDEIHNQYGKLGQPCYENLEKLTFITLPLDHFHLTDELYIKMNARGKQLTNFENFKADFIDWMIKSNGFAELRNYNGREMPHHMAFANKLDNEWAHFLWKLPKEMGSRPTLDELFIALFYRWFLFEYIITSEATNREMDKDKAFKDLEAENNYADLRSFDSLLSSERVRRLEHALDLFASHHELILKASRPAWGDGSPAYFLLDRWITQPQRVVLYAVWAYLDANTSFEETKFAQWMRVVWNIVENTDIDSWGSAIGVLKLIHELSEYSQDIYEKYPESLNAKSTAAEHERRKVNFIRKDASWEVLFIAAEKHPFLKGGIDFIIDAGMTPEQFRHRTEMVYKVFGDKGVSDTYRNDHILLRAIISEYSSFERLKNRNYTDTDEKEHYLKKMLAGDDVVKEALRCWLSLGEEELRTKLKQAVARPSAMDNSSTPFERKMHEELYKKPDLQNWMQHPEIRAIRFASHWNSYFASRKRAWYDWVMLDSYRDEMIGALVERYALMQPKQIVGTKYHLGKEIELKRKVELRDCEITFVYEFHEDGILRVGAKEGVPENDDYIDKLKCAAFNDNSRSSGWFCRKQFNYKEVTAEEMAERFLERVEKEVFDERNASSLVSQYNR